MAVLIYIAKLICCSGLLYGYYHFFLRNKRFHHYNRFYLLVITLLSFVIPFIQIPINLFGGTQHPVLIKTLKVISADGWEEPVVIYANRNAWINWLSLQNILWSLYAAGMIAGIFLLVRSLIWINRLRHKYPAEKLGQFSFYNTTEPGTPFSFFNTIFWNRDIAFNDWKGQQIFRHEAYHVKEKHSADVLFMEIACSIAWFNPFFYIIRKELRAIHEFLADEYAATPSNRYAYAELLVQQAIAQKNISLAHPFFHTQIKRRILMITKSNLVRRSGYISRIMALPLLFLLVSAFAVKITSKLPINKNTTHAAAKNITVVIDAGHGGIYPGTHGLNNTLEKDITLAISKKINELSPAYNINIVMTRKQDELVGGATNLKEDLENRVAIANDAKADLFISIHVNAAAQAYNTERTGFEAYLTKRKADNKSKLLSSAILSQIKDIYPVDETIKLRDVGIMVLEKSNVPATLIECGYVTNPKDAAFISDPANQEKVARKILEGIVNYSNSAVAINENTSEASQSDFISAETLSKMNVDDIKSISADMKKSIGIVYLKNGGIKLFNAKEVNEYYTTHHIDEPINIKTNVSMRDSVVDIVFTKDTTPATNSKQHGDKIFTKVEIEPEYPGGQQGWTAYLIKTVKYPQTAIKKNIQGTVIMEFVVNTDGKLSDVKAISGPEELKAESIRTIKESGPWIPAKENGVTVKAYKKQPITFKLG